MASLKGQLWHIHKSWCNGGVQNKDFGVALQTVLCHSFADSILAWFLE